jgi:hypothetical protein
MHQSRYAPVPVCTDPGAVAGVVAWFLKARGVERILAQGGGHIMLI